MYRNLNAEKIIETVGLLQDRITERFPESSLSRLAGELHTVSHETVERIRWIAKPHLWLRFSIGLCIVELLVLAVESINHVSVSTQIDRVGELIQALEAGLNTIVLMGAAIFFLFTLEGRVKRKRALKLIHELRSMAHIVDMHQLTKDPERLSGTDVDTASSPKRTMTNFELARYLDYCSELLSLIGKLAALHVQGYDDPVVLSAVDEVENLTTGLSRKIWQKIAMLNRVVA